MQPAQHDANPALCPIIAPAGQMHASLENWVPRVTLARLQSTAADALSEDDKAVCAALEALLRAVQASAADSSIPADLKYRAVHADKAKEAVETALRSFGLDTEGIVCR